MFQRRVNREDVDHGGWSCFPSAVGGDGLINPAVSFLTRGDGAKAWYGWPTDPALERLRAAWVAAPDRCSAPTDLRHSDSRIENTLIWQFRP